MTAHSTAKAGAVRRTVDSTAVQKMPADLRDTLR